MTTIQALLAFRFTSAVRRTVLILAVLIVAILTLAATTAFAESVEPWWHLTTIAQPSNIQPGQAKDEVQQITVNESEGTYELRDEGVGFRAYGRNQQRAFEIGWEPKKVQETLEEMYGENNVEVTGGPGAGRIPYEVYEVKFVGKLADEYVEPMTENPVSNQDATTVIELVHGRPDGTIVVNAANLGDADANPATQVIDIKDVLPAGLTAIGIEALADESVKRLSPVAPPLECTLSSLSCTFTGTSPLSADPEEEGHYASMIPPYYRISMRIAVNVAGGALGKSNEASITGGGAPTATVDTPITVSDAAIPFGIDSYEMQPEEAGGSIDVQAGSHPFQFTTSFNLNEAAEGRPVAFAKDLHFKLPPGIIGNPIPFARCSLADFLKRQCPADTAVGVAAGTARLEFEQKYISLTYQSPLFNLEPSVGEPARFGFVPGEGYGLIEPSVLLTTAVRTGGDYGVTVSVSNITETTEFLSSEVTFWGVPGSAVHDAARGGGCLADEFREVAGYGLVSCPQFETVSRPPPLMTLPTSCSNALHTTMEADSWLEPEPAVLPSRLNTVPMPGLDGCSRLPFAPEIKVSTDVQQASKPTGLTVDVHVPQEGQLNPEGLAQSNIKNIQVTLPEGVTLNPSAGDGLQACSEAQIGYQGSTELDPEFEPGVNTMTFTPKLPGSFGSSEPLQQGVNFCPDASKIAEATIRTPLLPNPLKGFVYLASPQNFNVFPQENPFGTHVAMYIVAEDPVSGSLVKLPGKVSLNETTGQITSTFEDNPQLPFEDAELHFFGGERAPLASPSRCGTYTTQATFEPWSGGSAVHSSSSFEITSGPNGTPCPGASLPFNPTLASGTTNNNAGSYSDLTTTMSRGEGQQNIQSVTLHYPPGVSGLLSGVKLCGEAQANAGTCGPESQIGETVVGVGVGGDPFTVTGGKVYITEKYDGAPFGLSITNPAKAGPFDLQEGRPVVVRAKIEVNPITAALTITTNSPSEGRAIPTIIEGFALQIQHVNVLINRPGFGFNPTNCTPMAVTGTINSAEGASSPVSVPFQVANCAVLEFKPGFKVSTSGKTSRASGASLAVKLTYPKAPFGTQANIKSVKVDLPKQLPSRLTTLQKACTAKQFESNPGGCPAASIVGHATAITPLIPVPLTGPAYFVSYGGAKFPELVIALQGYGVTLDLHGETFINKAGITSSTFHTIPDAPVGSFELTLPEGKYSALAANGNLCKAKLLMPTAFTAQNGMEIHESTPISATGCPRLKKAKSKKKHKGTATHPKKKR